MDISILRHVSILAILQTSSIAISIFIVYKIIAAVINWRYLEQTFSGIPGPKERHWLFGSFVKAKIEKHAASGSRFELYQNMCMCTLEVILRCAFSFSADNNIQTSGERHPYVVAVTNLTDGLNYRFRKYIDFLDILLTARDEQGNGLTPLEIRNEVDTFLFEGHDTTASGLSWILYSLAEHPEFQARCQEEIDRVIDDNDGNDLDWSDLGKLEYLTMCIKEGLRLHSPVAIVNRETTKPLDLGSRVIPKGTIVQINVWVMNHMADVWGDNHWEYMPDRFARDNLSDIKSFQYVPFSAGPRNCIGQNFAMNEMKVVLAKLLRKFTFTLDKDHVVTKKFSGVVRTEDGMYMYAKKRHV